MTEKYETKIEKISDLAYRMKFERTDSEQDFRAHMHVSIKDLLTFLTPARNGS